MPAVDEVRAPVRSADGAIHGYLRIALLPQSGRAGPAPLLDTGGEPTVEESLVPIQLLEGHEYRYEWEDLPAFARTIATDPEEAFQPDTADGLKGRLRPGLSTGTMQVLVRSGELTLGQLELEVRSRKLTYLSEYRWMLRDIAEQMTELVMDRFAVSSTSFKQEDTRDAVTLYQRFAFLRALIAADSFQLALNEITRRPHVAWQEHHETVVPGQPLKASAYTVRQLSRPGARGAWPEGPIKSIPLRLDRRRTEATHDTAPNRFVRFALERWRQVVADIDRGLAAFSRTPAVDRGRREVAQTLGQLDTVLHHDLFKDLGPLMRFPAFGRGMALLGSWTRPMRPDYSLIISTASDEPAGFEPVVLHFDAKYRVNMIAEIFGQEGEDSDADEPARLSEGMGRGGALRADLLKMHAYRDAIRRSAGAYVLYPGEDDPAKRGQYSEYHELLPGLGAFVLRPALDGEAAGMGTLRAFLEQVFAHVATRLTRHERGRYWLEEVYEPYALGVPGPSSTSLGRPGPGTTVLLGYVKNAAHWKWIQETKAYNVRTEGRRGGVTANAELLFSQLLLLYCPEAGIVALARIVSDPEFVERAAMKSTGYPDPGSDYLCVQFSWVSSQDCVTSFSADQIDWFVQRMGKLRGAPIAVRWAELREIGLN